MLLRTPPNPDINAEPESLPRGEADSPPEEEQSQEENDGPLARSRASNNTHTRSNKYDRFHDRRLHEIRRLGMYVAPTQQPGYLNTSVRQEIVSFVDLALVTCAPIHNGILGWGEIIAIPNHLRRGRRIEASSGNSEGPRISNRGS